MYIIHENNQLILSITIWQHYGHIEERMTIEEFPLDNMPNHLTIATGSSRDAPQDKAIAKIAYH